MWAQFNDSGTILSSAMSMSKQVCQVTMLTTSEGLSMPLLTSVREQSAGAMVP